MSLKVNGKAYDWGDVDVKFPGLALVVQEISYDDEMEMEESYGYGHRPRGYGTGNYKSSGKISLLRDDYEEFLKWCKSQGIPFYNLTVISIVVSHANQGDSTHIDQLKVVELVTRSHQDAQGDKGLTVDVDMIILGGMVTDALQLA